MEILEIASCAELKRAKNHLICAVMSGIIICMLSPILMQSNVLFNVFSFSFLIYSLYALYKFSKLSRAFIFRNYISMIGIQILCSLLLWVFEVSTELVLMQVLIVYFIIALGCNMYFSYKIAYEMSAITSLGHFITAFKLYAIASLSILVSIVCVILALDTSSISGNMRTDVAIAVLAEANSSLLFAFFILLIVSFAAFCIALGFILRGLIKMKYIRVRIHSQ